MEIPSVATMMAIEVLQFRRRPAMETSSVKQCSHLLDFFHTASKWTRCGGSKDTVPWIAPMIGGEGTSPNRCMMITWNAWPTGLCGTGTDHMLTASAHQAKAVIRPVCTFRRAMFITSSRQEEARYYEGMRVVWWTYTGVLL